MPVRDFRWLDRDEIKRLNWLNMSDRQREGFILEVDLMYPHDLHETHNSFPLAPEQLIITEDMLSPYAKGERKNTSNVECGIRTHARFHRVVLNTSALDRSANST